MKNKQGYSLREAIKTAYKTEPLKIDLAETVVEKVFIKQKKTNAVSEKGLYIAFVILIVGSIIYCLSFFKEFFLLPSFILLVPMIAYFGLSYKELITMSKMLVKHGS